MEQRTCVRCGRANYRPRAARCWRCKKSVENAKARGVEPPDPLLTFDCGWCGKRCVPGLDVDGRATKFCCEKHKKAWHHEHEEGRRVRRGPCCRVVVQLSRRWISGPCPECGHWVTRLASRGHGYCSDRCRLRQKRRRRRARTAGAGYKTLSFRTVAERDNWVCQLCGGLVDPAVEWPDPMTATLDHIIPLSQGGDHSEANGQLAHWRCNTLKGDGVSATPLGAQLALI